MTKQAIKLALDALKATSEWQQMYAWSEYVGSDLQEQNEKAIAALTTLQKQPSVDPVSAPLDDLSKCGQCNGEADNGIDRCIPPSANMCKKCCAEEEAAVSASSGVQVRDAALREALIQIRKEITNGKISAFQRLDIIHNTAHKALCQPANEVKGDAQHKRIVELEAQVISGFYEERVPQFRQGIPTHELEDAVTAKEVTRYVETIERLQSAQPANEVKGDENEITKLHALVQRKDAHIAALVNEAKDLRRLLDKQALQDVPFHDDNDIAGIDAILAAPQPDQKG